MVLPPPWQQWYCDYCDWLFFCQLLPLPPVHAPREITSHVGTANGVTQFYQFLVRLMDGYLFSHTHHSPFKFVLLCPLLAFSQTDLINLSNAPLSHSHRIIRIVRMRINSIITRRETTHKRCSCQSFSVKLFMVVEFIMWNSFEKHG